MGRADGDKHFKHPDIHGEEGVLETGTGTGTGTGSNAALPADLWRGNAGDD